MWFSLWWLEVPTWNHNQPSTYGRAEGMSWITSALLWTTCYELLIFYLPISKTSSFQIRWSVCRVRTAWSSRCTDRPLSWPWWNPRQGSPEMRFQKLTKCEMKRVCVLFRRNIFSVFWSKEETCSSCNVSRLKSLNISIYILLLLLQMCQKLKSASKEEWAPSYYLHAEWGDPVLHPLRAIAIDHESARVPPAGPPAYLLSAHQVGGFTAGANVRKAGGLKIDNDCFL